MKFNLKVWRQKNNNTDGKLVDYTIDNINADMSYFQHIVPCGITDKAVTSLEKELGRKIDIEEIKRKFKKYFVEVFECELGSF